MQISIQTSPSELGGLGIDWSIVWSTFKLILSLFFADINAKIGISTERIHYAWQLLV